MIGELIAAGVPYSLMPGAGIVLCLSQVTEPLHQNSLIAIRQTAQWRV
jgi:hypothetical protein